MADDARMNNRRIICASSDLYDGGKGVRFTVNWHGRPTPAFVIRYQGVPHAFLNQCGHVPVELDWQEGKFFDEAGVYLICATHGALYSPKDGHCVTGRCSGKGLTSLPVEERGDQICLIEHQLTEK
jgi:nitrite reductase/ring-hydroxylating ferredoxin subunit